jgi:trans-aconitate methyltransferase
VGTLLDVGCGFGGFGAALKAERPDLRVWGIDSAAEVVTRATEGLDHFVLGSFPDDVPDQTFDCITFNNSLEHLADPWHGLRVAKERLNSGGTIVVALPNVRQYSIIRMLAFEGKWEYREQGIMDRTHLRFFTRRSALVLFDECGFHVEHTEPLYFDGTSRASRGLALLGRRAMEFRAREYAFVARVR